jgi:hypothetical protein
MLWNFIFAALSFKLTARYSDRQFQCSWLAAALAGMTVATLMSNLAYLGLRVIGGTVGGALYVCSAFIAAIACLLCALFQLPGYSMKTSGLVRCVPVYSACMFATAVIHILLNVWPLLLLGGASGAGLGYSRLVDF